MRLVLHVAGWTFDTELCRTRPDPAKEAPVVDSRHGGQFEPVFGYNAEDVAARAHLEEPSRG